MLEDAHLVLAVVEQDDRVIDASIAVSATHVADLRNAVDEMKAELAAAVSHHGWRLGTLQFVAADPSVRAPSAPAGTKCCVVNGVGTCLTGDVCRVASLAGGCRCGERVDGA